MKNIIERLSKLNSHLEQTINTLNLACNDCNLQLDDEVKEALKTSNEDLNLTKTRIDELRQGKFCHKNSWTSVEHKISEHTTKLEKSCVIPIQVENSDKVAKEFLWKTEQLAKIDLFIQNKKEILSDNYKNQLKSIK